MKITCTKRKAFGRILQIWMFFITCSQVSVTQAQQGQYGYVKNITNDGGKINLMVDFVQMLTGKTAVEAAKKAGDADTLYNDNGTIKEIIVFDDYYILNSNPQLRKLQLSPTVKFKFSGVPKPLPPTFASFKKIYKDHLFKLFLQNNTVIKIEEEYLP